MELIKMNMSVLGGFRFARVVIDHITDYYCFIVCFNDTDNK